MSPRNKQPLTIEHALLGFLRREPLHGYELYQRLIAPEALGTIWCPRQSQFYALVTKLEQAGYLVSTLEHQDPHPPRKILRLTDEGEAAFAAWVGSPVLCQEDVQPEFLARLYFARLSGDLAVLKLVARQRATSRAWLDELQARVQDNAASPSYDQLISHLHIRQIEAFLHWLDTCAAPVGDSTLVTYPAAVLRESQQAALARQFVDYVCSPAGQAILAQHGFLPACEPPATTTGKEVVASSAVARSLDDQAPALHIFAAASLTDAFQVIGQAFAAASGVQVQCLFAGSQHLAEQITRGTPADVFAPASLSQMQAVVQTGHIVPGSERIFAHNQLVVVTPREHPVQFATLRDLALPGLRLVLGSQATAIGHYATDLFAQAEQCGNLDIEDRAALLQNVICYEENVRAVLSRVARGEADAGIVYTSDSYHENDVIASAVDMMTPGIWG
jgi:molybdate transport system substrate-binding protein